MFIIMLIFFPVLSLFFFFSYFQNHVFFKLFVILTTFDCVHYIFILKDNFYFNLSRKSSCIFIEQIVIILFIF